VQELASFLHTTAQGKQVKNPGLFETAAAYAAYIGKDIGAAKRYLGAADKFSLSTKVKDQWALTNLLVTINEKDKIDAAFEEQLLPSLQWLESRVKTEKPVEINYWKVNQWKTIYRSLLSEILARRYHAQGDLAKEALCIGAADWIMKSPDNYYWQNGVDFLRNKMMSADVEKLYALLSSKQASAFEQYLFTHNAVTKKEVVDFAGTSYLREYEYAKAIDWFRRSAEKRTISKNPFIELLYDREEQLPSENKFKTTKLAFAQEMLKLEQTAKQSRTAANVYYKMALGMYNMTYYGHTWELVQYYRGGTDGYYIPKNATGFQKEYYGCYKAHEYFEKAMNASSDKNFKARCLFMMAKCSQKQVRQPQYDDSPTTGTNTMWRTTANTGRLSEIIHIPAVCEGIQRHRLLQGSLQQLQLPAGFCEEEIIPAIMDDKLEVPLQVDQESKDLILFNFKQYQLVATLWVVVSFLVSGLIYINMLFFSRYQERDWLDTFTFRVSPWFNFSIIVANLVMLINYYQAFRSQKTAVLQNDSLLLRRSFRKYQLGNYAAICSLLLNIITSGLTLYHEILIYYTKQ